MIKYFFNNIFLFFYLILLLLTSLKNFFSFNKFYNETIFFISFLFIIFFIIKKKFYKRFYTFIESLLKKYVNYILFCFLLFIVYFYKKSFDEKNIVDFSKIVFQFFIIYKISCLFFIKKINFLPLFYILNFILLIFTLFFLLFNNKIEYFTLKKDLTNSLNYIFFFSFFLSLRYFSLFYKKITFFYIINFFLCISTFVYLLFFSNTYIYLFALFTIFIFITESVFKKECLKFFSITTIKKLIYLFVFFIFFSFYIYISDYFIIVIHEIYSFFLKLYSFIFDIKKKIVCDELISVKSSFGDIQNLLHVQFPVLCFNFIAEPPGYGFWIGFIERIVQYKIYLGSFTFPVHYIIGNSSPIITYDEINIYSHNSFLYLFSKYGLIIHLIFFSYITFFFHKLELKCLLDIFPIFLFFLGSTMDDYFLFNRYECTLFVWLHLLFNYHLKSQKVL